MHHLASPVVLVAATLCGVATPAGAIAADYLSVTDVQQLMFPDASEFVASPINLTADQRAALEGRFGGSVNTHFWNLWEAKRGESLLGYVMTDAVIGKFQLINYAVSFGPDRAIRDVEILSYRESHGAEVRTASWRAQFVGKTSAAPLAVGDDIANISGATLSCTHLTDGIRHLAGYLQLRSDGHV